MKSISSPATFKTPRLRVGLKDVSQEEFSVAVQEKFDQQRISIMLDRSVIAFFKEKAGDRGYQTLINQALHEVMRMDLIKSILRLVIREELHFGQK